MVPATFGIRYVLRADQHTLTAALLMKRGAAASSPAVDVGGAGSHFPRATNFHETNTKCLEAR
jgi:hypothetical protein